jgi:hypothetical protein
MAAFFASIAADLVYSVADDGAITPLTWATYEALPDGSPLLLRIRLVRSLAVQTSNKLRGLQDAPAVLTN